MAFPQVRGCGPAFLEGVVPRGGALPPPEPLERGACCSLGDPRGHSTWCGQGMVMVPLPPPDAPMGGARPPRSLWRGSAGPAVAIAWGRRRLGSPSFHCTIAGSTAVGASCSPSLLHTCPGQAAPTAGRGPPFPQSVGRGIGTRSDGSGTPLHPLPCPRGRGGRGTESGQGEREVDVRSHPIPGIQTEAPPVGRGAGLPGNGAHRGGGGQALCPLP